MRYIIVSSKTQILLHRTRHFLSLSLSLESRSRHRLGNPVAAHLGPEVGTCRLHAVPLEMALQAVWAGVAWALPGRMDRSEPQGDGLASLPPQLLQRLRPCRRSDDLAPLATHLLGHHRRYRSQNQAVGDANRQNRFPHSPFQPLFQGYRRLLFHESRVSGQKICVHRRPTSQLLPQRFSASYSHAILKGGHATR